MNLYLAVFNLERWEYMASVKFKDADIQYRLVRADDVTEAEAKLRKEVERDNPYGTSYHAKDIKITGVID